MDGAFITTPFGRVDLSFRAEHIHAEGAAESVRSSRPDGRILGWLFPELDAQLLLVPLTMPVPDGTSVTAAHVALWQISALAAVGPCVFEASFASEASLPAGGPDSGQALNALTWGDESVELSLGCPDAEGLVRYLRADADLPETWRMLLRANDPSTIHIEDYLPRGLRLRLPGLKPGETGYGHFAIAWASPPTDDPAPWFAVNVDTNVLRTLLDRMSNVR